jgi:hypothetical protein
MKTHLACIIPALLAPAFAHAANPWLPEAGRWNAALSYLQQTADEFHAGEMRVGLPDDLEQSTLAVSLSYAPNHVLAFDLALGYAQSDFTSIPELSPNAELDGLQDTRLGVRYLVRDEIVQEDVTVTLGAALIIAGDYETGALNAIGDGANGFEGLVSVGKQFGNGLALAGELGYRWRDENVPNEWFTSADVKYAFTDRVAARVGYAFSDSTSGIDIGAPGFTAARFPEVEEDFELVSAGVNVGLGANMALAIDYGAKIDGRNTARSTLWSITFGVSW